MAELEKQKYPKLRYTVLKIQNTFLYSGKLRHRKLIFNYEINMD